MSFFEELKRRNVFRVGIAYVLLGWAVLQGADFLLDLAGAPDWVIRALAVIGLVGFPFALFFAWAFELTPEGIKRESEVDRSESIAPQTRRKLNTLIIGLLLLVIVLMGVERVYFAGGAGPGAAGEAAGAPKSIAVLPFADLSQAQDQGWFADGLAEEILNALVKAPDLQVAARTSSFAYKGQSKPISEIADELGVAHVLEGSVRSAGDRIRVTAQLIRAADGFHLWSQNYDRDVADMIGIQEDLAKNIAIALETSMDPGAVAEMAQVGTDSVEAYQAYLRGLQLRAEAQTYSVGQRLSMSREAYEQFERARAIDPGFADAHVQAAEFWRIELTPNRMESGLTDLGAREQLTQYNERIGLAIERAKSEADRLRSLADRAMVDLRLREARQLFERYLELRPNDDRALLALSEVALMLSDQAAAQSAMAKLRERAGLSVNGAIHYAEQAWRAGLAGESAPLLLDAVKRWPSASQLLYQSHRTLLWAGRRQEAAELAARFEALVPGSHPVLRARVACAQGDRDAAERVLAGLAPDHNNYIVQRWLILNLLGRDTEAQSFLGELSGSGVPYPLSSFLVYPQFDPRPYPELMAVLEREGVQRPPPVEPPFKCPPPSQPSVAVLPFVNMSADPEQEYFSDGMTEEIINALVRVPGVKVAARTSVFAFKGQEKDIRAIGDALDVTHVVEGSVRSDGQQLRITAQLIQVSDGFHLWSETFDRPRANVFAIQEEIADAITGALGEQLGAEAAVPEALRISVKAYDDYLRGRAHLRARSDADLAQARELLEAVTEAHPDYAPAWATLAIAADVMDDHEPAERWALRALELQPNSVDALTALGAVYRDTWRWAESADHLERAMAIDPESAELLEDYAEFLMGTGRVAEAVDVAARGYAVDPYLDPLVGVYAEALIAAGQPQQALEVAHQALARGGADWLNGIIAMALVALDDTAGLQSLIEGADIEPAHKDILLGALAAPDDPAAMNRLAALYGYDENKGQDYLAAPELAMVLLLRLGAADVVLDALRQAFAADGWGSTEYFFMPGYAGLRASPGFAGLVGQIRLPAWWDQSGWPEFCRREAGEIRCQ